MLNNKNTTETDTKARIQYKPPTRMKLCLFSDHFEELGLSDVETCIISRLSDPWIKNRVHKSYSRINSITIKRQIKLHLELYSLKEYHYLLANSYKSKSVKLAWLISRAKDR